VTQQLEESLSLSELEPRPEAVPVDLLQQLSRQAAEEWGAPPERADMVARQIVDALRLAALNRGGTELTTDLGNARRLVRLYGRQLRFCDPLGGWLSFDGHRWARDTLGQAERWAKDTVVKIFAEVATARTKEQQKDLAKWAIASQSGPRLREMLRLASTEERVAAAADRFDRDPWLLNVENGTLNLQTGKLRAHDSEDHITKLAPVVWLEEAEAPRWLAFLEEIMDEDQERLRYLQKVIGYSLTGDTSEQALFVIHGSGANGKSTFIETLRRMLGDYARQADPSAFLIRRSEGPRNDIARLAGARFVCATETAEGRKLDAPMVKQMTGGDTITARLLYREFFEFRPTFKVFISTNHRPRVRGDDDAIWRRMRLIPFDVTIPKERQDKRLQERLVNELSGILRWAVEGCRLWRTEGLTPPEAVRAATSAYRSEMDVLGAFLEARTVQNCSVNVGASELYAAYRRWCKENGEFELSQTIFGKRLSDRGFERYRGGASGGYRYRGLALN
jgi:putative DNA primase/helicase